MYLLKTGIECHAKKHYKSHWIHNHNRNSNSFWKISLSQKICQDWTFLCQIWFQTLILAKPDEVSECIEIYKAFMRRSNCSAPILPRAPRGHHFLVGCPSLFITLFLPCPALINHFNHHCPFLSHTFWTLDLPKRVISNRPCPSVDPFVRPSVFKYLRDRSKDFSNFLHLVRAP